MVDIASILFVLTRSFQFGSYQGFCPLSCYCPVDGIKERIAGKSTVFRNKASQFFGVKRLANAPRPRHVVGIVRRNSLPLVEGFTSRRSLLGKSGIVAAFCWWGFLRHRRIPWWAGQMW